MKQRKTQKKSTQSTKSKKPCDQFCKNDYVVEMDKKYDKFDSDTAESSKNIIYSTCKKVFCNKTCKGYNEYKGKELAKFQSKIKNGFHTNYKKNRINALKQRGAVSACRNIVDYNVFHK
jgi:hypothetical protein